MKVLLKMESLMKGKEKNIMIINGSQQLNMKVTLKVVTMKVKENYFMKKEK